MNSIMKLTSVAIGAIAIASGVAVAQDASPNTSQYSAGDTANVSVTPGSALKRDGSLHGGATPAPTTDAAAVSTYSTSTSTSSTAAPASDPVVSGDSSSTPDTSPQPRADRN